MDGTALFLNVLDKPVDLDVLVDLTGREGPIVQELVKHLRENSFPEIPASVASVVNLSVALAALKGTGDPKLSLNLQYRAISLCRGFKDLRTVAQEIPCGSGAEWYLVKKAVELC